MAADLFESLQQAGTIRIASFFFLPGVTALILV